MSNGTVLVCDDREDVGQRWEASLKDLDSVSTQFQVETASPDQLADAITNLEERRSVARGDGDGDTVGYGDRLLDRADIVIIDYDLLNLDHTSFQTAETVAYLLRCYSTCGIIVSVNQFGTNDFDLALKGHPDSFADLHLGEHHLANPGLWQEPTDGWTEEFRPWSWPVLPQCVEALEERVSELEGSLDAPILEFLDFPAETAGLLPRSAVEFIEQEQDYRKTSFERFVRESGSGLKRRDEPLNHKSLRRIAAARITTWIERLLLPGQEVLVDAPHLVGRHPGLLTHSVTETSAWQRSVTHSFGNPTHLGINYHRLKPHYFDKPNWISRHAWFGRKMRNDPDLLPRLDELIDDVPDLVFAEDTSQFIDRQEAKEFVADVEGPYSRRYIQGVPDVHYKPDVRLTM